MQMSGRKWLCGLGFVLLLGVCWWQFGPRRYALIHKSHKFEYLEPMSASKNRSARLRIWVGYEGRRPRWWGQELDSKVQGGHQWSFSNGVNVQGGGGFSAIAKYDPDKQCYRYDLEKGLTAYRIENGQMIAVASGLATRCSLTITYKDLQSRVDSEIPMSLELKEGQEVFED